MLDNRYFKNRDMRRGVAGSGRDRAGQNDGHYARFKEHLQKMGQYQEPKVAQYGNDLRGGQYAAPDSAMNRDNRSDYTNPMYPHNDGRADYGREYYIKSQDFTYDGKGSENEFKEDLERWIHKLKRKDRFGMPKEEVLNHAKNMGIRFDEFSQEEFYAVYLMMVSDYKSLGNDFKAYLHLAKEWLMDDDIEVSPSEKLCVYYYEIVKGESTK